MTKEIQLNRQNKPQKTTSYNKILILHYICFCSYIVICNTTLDIIMDPTYTLVDLMTTLKCAAGNMCQHKGSFVPGFRLLPCLHLICQPCAPDRTESKGVRCNECREYVDAPLSGCYYLDKLRELQLKLNDKPSKCWECKKLKRTLQLCPRCLGIICNTCLSTNVHSIKTCPGGGSLGVGPAVRDPGFLPPYLDLDTEKVELGPCGLWQPPPSRHDNKQFYACRHQTCKGVPMCRLHIYGHPVDYINCAAFLVAFNTEKEALSEKLLAALREQEKGSVVEYYKGALMASRALADKDMKTCLPHSAPHISQISDALYVSIMNALLREIEDKENVIYGRMKSLRDDIKMNVDIIKHQQRLLQVLRRAKFHLGLMSQVCKHDQRVEFFAWKSVEDKFKMIVRKASEHKVPATSS